MSEGIRVLIVDDEVDFLNSIAKRLELREFDVTKASRGVEAIEAARTGGFDLALLDLKMPGIDGEEVLEILKQEHKYLEVIILTGHGSIDSAVECTKLGAFGYLSKPYELDRLLEVLKEAYEARLTKKYADDQERLSQIMAATEELSAESILKKFRQHMVEHPTPLSVLKALRRLDDDEK